MNANKPNAICSVSMKTKSNPRFLIIGGKCGLKEVIKVPNAVNEIK